jgi:Fic family protein
MAYVETIRRNGQVYYYVTKNIRLGPTKWKKLRKYMGKKKPSRKSVREVIEELESKALETGHVPKSPLTFLSEADAERLEDLKRAYRRWYSGLRPDERRMHDEDLMVRFTYNTNAIEGNRLTLRETSMALLEDLVPPGSSRNDYTEALNSRDALELMAAHKGGLSRRFVQKLHREIVKDTDCRLVGEYRDIRVMIHGSAWTPPPPDEVHGLMEKVFQMYRNHKDNWHPLELGAVAHVKIAQIHPFTDGNGRVARLVMNWVLTRSGYPLFYIEDRDKKNYYRAIEAADGGDDAAFVKYVAEVLIRQYTVGE